LYNGKVGDIIVNIQERRSAGAGSACFYIFAHFLFCGWKMKDETLESAKANTTGHQYFISMKKGELCRKNSEMEEEERS
jgi:hypothetical protein